MEWSLEPSNIDEWLEVVKESGFMKYLWRAAITRGFPTKHPASQIDLLGTDLKSHVTVFVALRESDFREHGREGPVVVLLDRLDFYTSMWSWTRRSDWTSAQRNLLDNAFFRKTFLYLNGRSNPMEGTIECWRYILRKLNKYYHVDTRKRNWTRMRRYVGKTREMFKSKGETVEILDDEMMKWGTKHQWMGWPAIRC